jgi:uncharacterized membrane protein HdeD (DUF308 family)
MSDQPTATPILDGIRENASVAVTAGIVLVIMGFLAIAAPLAAGLSITTIVGILLAVGGISQSFLAFRAGAFGRGLWIFAVGLLMAITGIYMFTQPVAGLAALTIMLVAYLFATGICELIIALQIRPGPGWGWTMLSAVITLLLAIMLWRQFPVSGIWAIGILFGIKMIFSGWSLVFLGRNAKAISDAVKAEM